MDMSEDELPVASCQWPVGKWYWTVPEVGGRRVERIRKRVVLPEPLGPRKAKIWLGGMERERSERAVRAA
jgi:hypothetical protein